MPRPLERWSREFRSRYDKLSACRNLRVWLNSQLGRGNNAPLDTRVINPRSTCAEACFDPLFTKKHIRRVVVLPHQVVLRGSRFLCAPSQLSKRAAGQATKFSRSGVELLHVIGAARLECDEPPAEAGELIRRQLGNSFGDFFDLHVAQYIMLRLD